MFARAVHPGEILRDELEELGITPTAFARQIAVPPNRVSRIVAGKRSITGDTASASATGSAPIRSSGSTFKRSTTWPTATRQAGRRSAGYRTGPRSPTKPLPFGLEDTSLARHLSSPGKQGVSTHRTFKNIARYAILNDVRGGNRQVSALACSTCEKKIDS